METLQVPFIHPHLHPSPLNFFCIKIRSLKFGPSFYCAQECSANKMSNFHLSNNMHPYLRVWLSYELSNFVLQLLCIHTDRMDIWIQGWQLFSFYRKITLCLAKKNMIKYSKIWFCSDFIRLCVLLWRCNLMPSVPKRSSNLL